MKVNRDAYGTFALAARLAGKAIDAATELVEKSGDSCAEETLLFWHRVRDFNGTAALMCAGGTENVPEKMVAASFSRAGDRRPPNGH